MEHFRRYSRKELQRKLKKSGFKIIKLNYWNSLLFPAIAIMRIIKKFLRFFMSKTLKPCSEASTINPRLNTLLFWIINFENKEFLFKKNLPFGLSIYGVARKK